MSKVPVYRPQLATLVDCPPEGDKRLQELKLDGFRIGCVIEDGQVDYYQTKLGFALRWRANDDVAEVQRPGIDLILSCGSSLPSSRAPGVLSAELHDHIKLDQLHADFVHRGARVRRAPFQVSWQPHVHQLEVEDLDGNLLLFWGDLP